MAKLSFCSRSGQVVWEGGISRGHQDLPHSKKASPHPPKVLIYGVTRRTRTFWVLNLSIKLIPLFTNGLVLPSHKYSFPCLAWECSDCNSNSLLITAGTNLSSSLRLLIFLPSSSWSKLQAKKTLSIYFFLVLLDVFILGSFTRVNKNCELTEQVGKVVSLLSFFLWLFFSSLGKHVFPWLWLRHNILFFKDPTPPLVTFAGIISSWGKELIIKYTKGL